jgi:short-subunit dehydrogenase
LALVTGASSGIGHAYARRLAQNGWDLVVVARRGQRLEDLAQLLHQERGSQVEAVVADLSNEEGLARVERACRDRPLAMLVNSAALGHYMPFLQLPAESVDELVHLNVLAPTRLARASLPGMVKRGTGALINVASLLAFSGQADLANLPRRAVYASSKSYLVTFSRILAAEIRGTGVKVQVVCPGVVRSEFHSRQGIEMSQIPTLEPDQVVEASLAALERNEVVCIPTLEDPEKLSLRDHAEVDLMFAAFTPVLAPRYREGESHEGSSPPPT